MNDSCETQEVILQENGIIRDKSGKFLGRMVKDIDAMCEEQYNRGRIHEREACAKECEGRGITYAPHCAAAIRARNKHE